MHSYSLALDPGRHPADHLGDVRDALECLSGLVTCARGGDEILATERERSGLAVILDGLAAQLGAVADELAHAASARGRVPPPPPAPAAPITAAPVVGQAAYDAFVARLASGGEPGRSEAFDLFEAGATTDMAARRLGHPPALVDRWRAAWSMQRLARSAFRDAVIVSPDRADGADAADGATADAA